MSAKLETRDSHNYYVYLCIICPRKLDSSSVLSEHEYTIKLCTLLFHLNWLLSHPQRHFAKRISPPPFGTQAWPEFPPFSMIFPIFKPFNTTSGLSQPAMVGCFRRWAHHWSDRGSRRPGFHRWPLTGPTHAPLGRCCPGDGDGDPMAVGLFCGQSSKC